MGYRISGLTVAAKVNWRGICVRPLETTQGIATAQDVDSNSVSAQVDVHVISAGATRTITLSGATTMPPPPMMMDGTLTP